MKVAIGISTAYVLVLFAFSVVVRYRIKRAVIETHGEAMWKQWGY